VNGGVNRSCAVCEGIEPRLIYVGDYCGAVFRSYKTRFADLGLGLSPPGWFAPGRLHSGASKDKANTVNAKSVGSR
jgi:hypothetical protein